jgi:hypothetical protein
MKRGTWCVVFVIPGYGLDIVSRHWSRTIADANRLRFFEARVMHIQDVMIINSIYRRRHAVRKHLQD